MPRVQFKTYYRYNDLVQILQGFAEEHPHLVTVKSIGKSYEGRDIWLVTVTNSETGDAESKPALWLTAISTPPKLHHPARVSI